MTRITKHLVNLQTRIGKACAACGRNENDVSILAVSKRHDVDAVRDAHKAGLNAFGENYLQEALPKIAKSPADIRWHFIGRLQSNKTRAIAEHFDWVQTVTSAKVAERLNAQRSTEATPLNICLQVDTDAGAGHGGVHLDAAAALCARIIELPRLRLRGLMTIPLPAETETEKRRPLQACKTLFDDLRVKGFDLDTLSMGMTSDLEIAIEEGSTMVRIGTALFGARPE